MASGTKQAPFDKDAGWTAIKLVLEPLFTFPNEALHADLPHSITPAEYSAAYTAVHEWARTPQDFGSTPPHTTGGFTLYPLLDGLLEEKCRIAYTQLQSLDSNQLLQAYGHLYMNFLRRSATAARILAPLDRHVWMHPRETGHGWLSCPFPDMKTAPGPRRLTANGWEEQAVPITSDARERSDWTRRINDHERAALIGTWELSGGSSINSEAWVEAVNRAEAARDPGEVACVRAYSLGLRRWRMNVLEPLLAGFFSSEELVIHQPDGSVDSNAGVGLLLKSMKDVGLKTDNKHRMRLQHMHGQISSGLAQGVVE
jgi:hypothetical protein